MSREIWITGTGLLSPFGEGLDAALDGLDDPVRIAAAADSETFAPFHVHPVPDVDLSAQIPKPGDQRAMGPMMHYGVYAAGMALDDAGLKGDEELLLRTNLLVASGGGERDWELDTQILRDLPGSNDPGPALNQYLADGLRPTLFLAQLPNLFAGNISIVHKVTGSSRTFMGEEEAGMDTVRIAFERIQARQGEMFVVGGAYNAARYDIHLMYHAAGLLLAADKRSDVWGRPDGGVALGSAGAFAVIESREHAEARGATPIARLRAAHTGRSDRTPGAAAAEAGRQWAEIEPLVDAGPLGLLSGASGAGPVTREEHDFLAGIVAGRPVAVRGTGTALGHSVEASFLVNLILAAGSVRRGALFGPLASDVPLEAGDGAGVRQVAVTGWGHRCGEGMALVEAIDG